MAAKVVELMAEEVVELMAEPPVVVSEQMAEFHSVWGAAGDTVCAPAGL